jgi:hypothetical protein
MSNRKQFGRNRDIDGPATLETPDVLAMMQPVFWHRRSLLKALLLCAVVALLACCHVQTGFALNIRLKDWRPKGLYIVRVRRYGAVHDVAITMAVAIVVGRYLVERERIAKKNGWQSKYLFVSSSGEPVPVTDIQMLFNRLSKRIRARGTIAGMLKNFCQRHLGKGGDDAASRCFRGLSKMRGSRVKKLPEVPAPRIERLLRRTDPFKHMERQLDDEAAAARWLADHKPAVPIVLSPHRPPPDHPLVVELRRVRWPRGKHACRVLRAQLWTRYGERIDALMRDRVLDGNLVAKLLHTTLGNVYATIRYHYRREGERPFKGFHDRDPKPRASEADLAVIAEIETVELSDDPATRAAEVLARACRHAEAVHSMIDRGLLKPRKAADLLGIDYRDLCMVRSGLREGVAPEIILCRPAFRRVPKEWWDKVRAAAALRPEGDTATAFFCRLAGAGFPGGFDVLDRWCRDNATVRPQPATETEQAFLARLEAVRWSSDPLALEAQRSRTVVESLVDLDRLVSEGKLGPYRAAALLKLQPRRFASLRHALRAGVAPARALAPVMPVRKEVWDAIAAEHALSPEEDDLVFFWRVVAKCGYTGGQKRLKTFRKLLAFRANLFQDAA